MPNWHQTFDAILTLTEYPYVRRGSVGSHVSTSVRLLNYRIQAPVMEDGSFLDIVVCYNFTTFGILVTSNVPLDLRKIPGAKSPHLYQMVAVQNAVKCSDQGMTERDYSMSPLHGCNSGTFEFDGRPSQLPEILDSLAKQWRSVCNGDTLS